MPMLLRFLAVLLSLCMLPLSGCEKKKEETPVRTTVRDEGVKPPVEEPPKALVSTQEAFIEVSKKVTPAVVNIRAARMRPGGGGPFDDLFGDVFPGHPGVQPQKEQSLGSGFLISEDGFILTNAHVISDASEIKVQLSDQRVYSAKMVGIDPKTDVAVLKIQNDGKLPAVVLGNSDKLRIGEWALAIGNPFGLEGTLTVGIISATGRAGLGIEDYEDFIQTDTSINPGNSGGPLLNIYGEVIGINTAIVAAGQGIGFAIPINLARQIADQLIETGEVSRGWLGVSIQPLTPELADSFGLDRVTGALVNQIVPDSPAAKAGLRRGDILLTYDGKEVRGVRELQLMVASTPAGKKVNMEVVRGGKRMTLPVTIVPMEADRPVAGTPGAPPGVAQGLGLTVAPAEGGGVVVESVDPRSAAGAAGVQPGDLVIAVNRDEIRDIASFREATKKIKKGRNVVLLLQRGDSTLYLAFPAP